MKKTVLLADSQYVAIHGTIFILNNISHDIVIDYVLNKEALMDKLRNNEYDLLILDIDILDIFYESAIQALHELCPSLKIMIFTSCSQDTACQYICQGVSSVMSKLSDEAELRKAFISIFVHGYYYPQEILYDFIHNLGQISPSFPPSLDILSYRERSVYFYLVKGNGILEIANKLGLHQSTISVYKKRLFKKLKVKSLVELIRLYYKYGISGPGKTFL
ncbi:DNA-binding response regulator [Chryseobacterium nematophagum]|uniref:DNA-binding response regulator n=1 Tax=Chryseobacterium nematophagum TaxID=2305228 RepID=A0A3M7TDW4_9FLAO|nr:LuxR C-terminal-related transcriptional regulator [Chryseobacterium nematophagum]RNA61478.1 DNA-binding response regulator [Chryseobacterium nematophagum]